jgi:hypothetical protein
MMMSDISGIRDINVSVASRGTSITRVSLTARTGIDHAPYRPTGGLKSSRTIRYGFIDKADALALAFAAW